MVTERNPRPALPEASSTDAQVMVRLAGGDLEALGELYLRYGTEVAAMLRYMLPQALRQDVDDLCQDVFLEVKDLARRYEERGHLRAWLIEIAMGKARNCRRKQWLRQKLLREQPPRRGWGPLGPAEDAGGIATRLDMQAALEQLSAAHREVLILHVVMGMTAEEISAALGIKPGSVWSRVHRARRELLGVLERSGEAGPSRPADRGGDAATREDAP